MGKTKIKTEDVEISKLKPSEYNPRQMKKEQVDALTKSIRKFGIVDPLIANSYKGRENVVIGGHQRLKIALSEGFSTVPVVYVKLPLEAEKELNIRLNKNQGEWDFDLLANNFDLDVLQTYGFDDLGIDFKPEVTKFNQDTHNTEDDDNSSNLTVTLLFNEKEYADYTKLIGKLKEKTGKHINKIIIGSLRESAKN